MPPRRKRIAVLGSTGSIGRSVLAVAEAHPDAFEVVSLSALRSVELLAEQAARFGARRVVVGEGVARRGAFPDGVDVGEGERALEALASDPDADLVINALVGASGLLPTVAAVRSGKRVALANKESLVMAGDLIMRTAAETGSEIVPVDSEHSSIFRCLRGTGRGEVDGLLLTASGGPLRALPRESVTDATIDQVLAHPTWTMGEKVTVDSATLVNKAMEVIEARWLFDIAFDRIDVVTHRESIVHSFVRLTDGSLLAHLGVPDMRVPIQFAMFYPDPPGVSFGECRPAEIGVLHFEPVDHDRYPCFRLVLRAGEEGGTSPAIAATADEVAVGAFVAGDIRFGDVPRVIDDTLAAVAAAPANDLESVLTAEKSARLAATRAVEKLKVSRS